MRTSKRLHLGFEGGFVGALDSLGIQDNAVYIFSPFKNLLSSYTGDAVKVQRSSDYTSKWFGYKANGDLDTDGILSFCGAGDGLIEEVINPYDTDYNTKQTSLSLKPKIVISGVLQTNGIKFDAVDDYMNIEKYSAINITDHPMTIFVQSNTPVYANGYYIVCNTDGTTTQYSFYNQSSTLNWKLNVTSAQTNYQINTQENLMGVYRDGGTDAHIVKTNNNEVMANYSATLTEQSFVNIGARSTNGTNTAHSVFYNGFIKTIIIFNSDEYDNYSNLVELI